MANKKISFEDVFEEDFFQRIAVSAQTFEDVLKSLDKTITQVGPKLAEALKEATQATPNAENLRRLSETLRTTDQTARGLADARAKLAKATEQLNKFEAEHEKELIRVKQELAERRKDLKDLARSEAARAQQAQLLAQAEKGVFESYSQLNETLGKLRTVYKDLAAQGKGNTEEALRLAAAIGKLDKEAKRIDENVGQFQRNVGNYANSIMEVFADFRAEAQKAGGAVGGVSSALFTVADAFKAAGGGLKGMAAGTKALGQSLKSLGILTLLSLLAEGINKVTDSFKDYFSESGQRLLEEASRNLTLTRQRVEAEDALSKLKIKQAATTEKDIGLTNTEFQLKRKLLLIELQAAAAELSKAQRAKEAARNKEQEAEAINQIAAAEARLAEVRRQLAENEAERRAAVEAIQKEQAALIEAERKRAEEERRRRAEAEEQRRQTLAGLLKELEAEKQAAATKTEAARQAAEAEEREARAIAAKAAAIAKTAAEREQVEQALSAKLEAIAAKREAAIAEIQAEAARKAAGIAAQVREKGLEAELLAIQDKYKALREELTAAERELGEAQAEVRKAIAAAEQRERQEVLRRAAMDELAFAEAMEKARLDQQASEFETRKVFEEYKQKQLAEIEIKYLRQRLDALAAFTGKEVELEKQKIKAQIALADLAARDIGTVTVSLSERLKAVAKEISGLADVFSALIDRALARSALLIERQLVSIRRRQDLLIAQIAAGSVSAGQSLAELEKQESELIRQQEALKRQAQRREAALAVFRAYAGQLQQGVAPAQALLNTIRDFQLLAQLIRTLPTFHHGTEYITTATHPKILNTSRDALLARVEEGERIVPAAINRQLKGIPNEQLPELIKGKASDVAITFDADAFTESLATIVKQSSKTTRIWRSL